LDNDVELLALRYVVRLLKRQLYGRVRYRPADRAILAALSRLLPRALALVSCHARDPAPRTPGALASQVETMASRATSGRPPLRYENVELIVRLGREASDGRVS
jgi:hypothetical protein